MPLAVALPSLKAILTVPSNDDSTPGKKSAYRDIPSRATTDNLVEPDGGWNEAKPFFWLALGASAGALLLFAGLLGWLPLPVAPGLPSFVLLAALGLCVGIVLFGALRARARHRGQRFGRGVELGVPVVGGLLALGLGFLVARPPSEFDLTVIVQGGNSSSERPLKGTGAVWIQLGDERRREAINDRGQVVFARLPLRFQMEESTVGVEVAGFETVSPTGPVRITGKPLTVVVRRSAKTLRGEVTDELGVPVGGAQVYVLDGPTKRTDELGRFEMLVPGDTAAGEIDFAVTAEKFLVYRKRFSLGDNPEPLLVKLRRVP